MTTNDLFAVPPDALNAVRAVSHAAVQWPSRAARANLAPVADDSHSNLGWNDAVFGFLSHPLDAAARFQLGFSYDSGALLWLQDGVVTGSIELVGIDPAAAAQWCDGQLQSVGLNSVAEAQMPYELGVVNYSDLATAAGKAALQALGRWYADAQGELIRLVQAEGAVAITPPQVRCWPHHYDLGTLFALDAGDPETARSVGVGLSPGDGSYAEPYFYCTPWPTPTELGTAPVPWRWHTDGFTSLVCPGSRMNPEQGMAGLLAPAFQHAFEMLKR